MDPIVPKEEHKEEPKVEPDPKGEPKGDLQLTPEDIKEIEQEPGDVTDIPIEQIDKDKLDQLRELVSKLPRDQAMQLIENLTKGHVNPVNPNNNMYSTTSKKEMLKYKLQQKIRQKQFERKSHAGQQIVRNRYEEKVKTYEKDQAELVKKPADEASEIKVQTDEHPDEHNDDHNDENQDDHPEDHDNEL